MQPVFISTKSAVEPNDIVKKHRLYFWSGLYSCRPLPLPGVWPNRLFPAEKSIITRKVGTVKPEVFEKVTDKLFEII